MRWTPSDEGRHDDAPGAEGWELAFGAGRTTGRVHLILDVAHGRAGFVADLIVPGTGRIVVADESVPVPRPTAGLEIRADGLWASLYCETPFEHWSLGLEAFGLRVDGDTAGVRWEDLVGERLAVGYDLEWERSGEPTPLADGVGYTQAGVVHGDVLLVGDRVAVDAPSIRTHWWGGEAGRLSG